MHRLHEMLVAAAGGIFPAVDGRVDVLEPERPGHHAVVEFTGHAVVLTDQRAADVLGRGADGFGGVSQPDLVRWLAGPTGTVGSQDAVLVTRGRGGGSLPACHTLDDHPRVERARRHRRGVQVYGDEHGFITIGTGLVGRTEVSVELIDPNRGGAGHGRRLIEEARRLVPAGSLLWAQVAPGNAASLRAFLACDFTPIGAEMLIHPLRS